MIIFFYYSYKILEWLILKLIRLVKICAN
jgi:hypothetical protein